MLKNSVNGCNKAQLCYLFLWFFCAFVFFYVCGANKIYDCIGQILPINGDKNVPNFTEDPMQFIFQSTQSVWEKRDFLIVFGFPSLDIPLKEWRRHMQRITCWQFPEVATKENNFTGALLPLYLLAKHSLHNFVISSQLVDEVLRWQDIVIHPVNEGRSTTNKIVEDVGYWGNEAEIGSSRKTFFWFQFALLQFPRVPFVAKGDDETFISVPQFLLDLRSLPREKIYWGRYISKNIRINNKGSRVSVGYMLGYCVTLARDTAEAFLSYKPLKRLVLLPYNKTTEPEFIAMNMQYEDVMVGRVLQEVNFSTIYVLENSIRFHVYTPHNATDKIVATHKPKEHEYYALVHKIMFLKKTHKAAKIFKKNANWYYMKSSA